MEGGRGEKPSGRQGRATVTASMRCNDACVNTGASKTRRMYRTAVMERQLKL